ncbi:MAG TPA: hypothetical protein VGZ47_05115 [Gemmataceae bacterium]|nr:hypothetical protein [Gemmataceae bacterium]
MIRLTVYLDQPLHARGNEPVTHRAVAAAEQHHNRNSPRFELFDYKQIAFKDVFGQQPHAA